MASNGNTRGITIEFRGNATKLNEAIRTVNSETRNLDKELRNVNRALKFNPGNVELLKHKQALLSAEIEKTGEKLELLKREQKELDDDPSVDKNSAEYMKLRREIIETDSKLKHFKGEQEKLNRAMNPSKIDAYRKKLSSVGNNLEKAGQKMQAVSAAGAALTATIGAMAYKAGVAADDLNTLSKVTGIGTDDLQKYATAASLVDVSVEAIAKSNKRLTKSMYSAQNGSESQSEAFEKLGVDITNADGSLRDSDAVFQDVITALGSMKNETERDALAMELMGKSASELNPLIEDGGETYKRVSDTLKKYNLDFVDQSTLDKANDFNDQLDTMKVIGTVAVQSISTQLAGYLAPALGKVVEFVGKIAQWLSTLSPEVLTVVGIVGAVLAVLAPLLMVLGKLAFAINSIMGLASTMGISLTALAGPVGIAIAIIAALIAVGVLLYKNWDTVKAKAKQFANYVVSTFKKLKSGVASAWNAIKTAITKPITDAINKVKNLIDKVKGFFPIKVGNIFSSLKLPHFDWHWKKVVGGIKLPVFDGIDWYAQGGIFNSPSVIGVGEAGPEAVLPISKLQDMLRANNADLISAMGSGVGTVVVPVYLYKNGPQMGREIVNIYDTWKKRV